MDKLNIIELIARTGFDNEGFNALIDPEGRLTKDKREDLWQHFKAVEQNLISFYNTLDGEQSEVEYVKWNINSFFDQKVAERLNKQSAEAGEQGSPEKKIKPIDDLEGSASWGTNDDVKWK